MQRVYETNDPVVIQIMEQPGEFETMADPEGRGRVFAHHPRTLSALYEASAAHAGRTMLVDGDRTRTYADAFSEAARISWTLRTQLNIGPGDRVAIVSGNRAEWIVSFIAITAMRAIAVLVNSRGAPEELVRAIRLSGCKAGVTDKERAALLSADNPLPGQWIHIDGDPAALGGMTYSAALSEAPTDARLPDEALPNDGAAALFTSGTTGFPKAALLTQGALAHMVSLLRMASAMSEARYELEIGAPPREAGSPVILASPLFHISGIAPLLKAMHFGSPLTLVRKWSMEAVFDAIETGGVDRLGLVATMLWDMLQSPRGDETNLGRMRFVAMGGMPISEALIRELATRMPKCQIATGYGMTETAGIGARLCGAPYVENPNAVGWVLPTLQMRVEREDGSDADIGEIGEVCLRGPCLLKEYMYDPAANAEAFRGGWFHSGDLGYMDEASMLRLVDRKKNMVISGGENIYCAEVERVLANHEAVAEVLAYGVPDERLGERLAATVVPISGATPLAEELKAYAADRLAIYKVPRDIFFQNEPLARTASGKVSRAKLHTLPQTDK